MGETVVRLIFSLAVVIGLIIILARMSGRARIGNRTQDIRVISRQALGRTSSLTVTEVHGRTLLLGVTEQSITLLSDLTPGSVTIPASQQFGQASDLATASDGNGDGDGDSDGDGETAAARSPLPDTHHAAGRSAAFGDHLTRLTGEDAEGVVVRTTSRFRSSTPSHRADVPSESVLAGSVLSPQTWRAAFNGLGRAS